MSNNEKSGGREVQIGYLSLFVKKPYAIITKENWKLLQLIDLANETDIGFLKKHSKALSDYVRKENMEVDGLFKSLPSFPNKAAKKIISSGIIGAFLK